MVSSLNSIYARDVMSTPVAYMMDETRIHVSRPPVVCGDRIRPIAVAPIHLRKIGAAQLPVLDDIEPVAAADIDRRSSGDLHRPLRTVRLGAPHSQICPVARLGAIDREGDAIEIGFPRRTEQIDGGRR